MYPSTILIVDDDEEFRRFLVTILQDEGFTVTSASTGAEAVERVLRDKPHLAIIDLMMPDMAGDELCRMIKNDPVLREIIVIILSGSTDVDTKLNCFNAGANEYLTKPMEARELVARVRRFFRMVDELKAKPHSIVENPPEKGPSLPFILPTEDTGDDTVDFVASESSESSIRIKPKYGVYRIESLIGSGAMGHVFKAYDENLERFVAIKILSKRLSNSQQFVERFRREAKVLAAINHPGIAFIYSFGEEDGDHYFAIQWCPGGSLADLIRKKGRIEVLPAVDIVLQSAQALGAASKKGIVHRDVKPSNLLFDENQQVKIVDFGLALSEKMPARITSAQEFLGTPDFMAPEQAQSSVVDSRADIYSLGITFYCMLYGKLPFVSDSAIEMVVKHASEAFPGYDNLGGTVPRQAYDIVERMTKKNPEERYPHYGALIQDVEVLRNMLLSEAKWKLPRAQEIAAVPSIRSTDLFELLTSLFTQSTSGVLTVRWGKLQKRFLVRQRDIILFESSQPDEDIWNVMAQKNLLRKDDLPSQNETAEAVLNRFLFDERFSIEEFKITYRELMKAALIQVFFWPVFEGEFSPAMIEYDALSTIRIADVLLEGARNFVDYLSIHNQIPRGCQISRTPLFDELLSTLNLKPEESFIASRFEGQETTINTLQLLTGLPEESIERFVFALQMLGALSFRIEEQVKPPRVKRRTAGPPSAAPPPPPPPAAATRAHSKSGSSANLDSRVTRTATSTGAKKSDDAYLMHLMTGRFVDSSTSLEKEGVESIDKRNAQVRMEVIKSERKIEAEHHVKVAEQFFQLAQEKYGEGDFWNVAQLCKQAIKNHPTEPRYYHLMAVAYAQHPRFGKDAEQCFYKALEMDPWNPDYHFDLAHFYLKNGLSRRALAECQKALKIAPQHEGAAKLYEELSEKSK